MQERHSNKSKYFNEQGITTSKYVIPYIKKHFSITKESIVLEIGCGKGGNLKPFLDMGCKVTGVDISEGKINSAKELFRDHPNKNNLTLVCSDIYDKNDLGIFDVVFLRDVIEHITNQRRFMDYLHHFIDKDSVIFFGFPPWQNPFGGHQQICVNRLLSKLPYFHLLPMSAYKALLKLFGESQLTIKNLEEIKETGISIDRFKKIINETNYTVMEETHYFINPNYEVKFGLKPRKQINLIASIPFIRNFFTTAVYFLIKN